MALLVEARAGMQRRCMRAEGLVWPGACCWHRSDCRGAVPSYVHAPPRIKTYFVNGIMLTHHGMHLILCSDVRTYEPCTGVAWLALKPKPNPYHARTDFVPFAAMRRKGGPWEQVHSPMHFHTSCKGAKSIRTSCKDT